MALALFTIFVNLFCISIVLLVLVSIIKGAPPVPSGKTAIEKILSLAEGKAGEKMVDLGAGDGRIVCAFAEQGLEAHGYEINPLLVWWGKYTIWKGGLQGKAFMHCKNLWKQDLSSFDVIVIYGLPNVMKSFEQKLTKELRPGARVLSNWFELPTWKPLAKEETVYLYKKE